MSRAWAKGSTRRWRRIRAHVLARDSYTCQLRIPRICQGAATQAHHTLGRAITGDDPRFIVAACQPCNGHVGDPTKSNPQPKRVSRW